MITWLNSNQGFASIILSITSLLLAGLAIWISISTNKKQVKLQLFNERYAIFERFSTLFENMNVAFYENLTYKDFIMLVNAPFFWNKENDKTNSLYPDNFTSFYGTQILRCNDRLEQLTKNDDEYEALVKERRTAISGNFFELFIIYEKDKRLLQRSRLFFPIKASEPVARFLVFYKEFVTSLNYVDEEEMQKIIVKGRELLKEIKEARVLIIMDGYLGFTEK